MNLLYSFLKQFRSIGFVWCREQHAVSTSQERIHQLIVIPFELLNYYHCTNPVTSIMIISITQSVLTQSLYLIRVFKYCYSLITLLSQNNPPLNFVTSFLNVPSVLLRKIVLYIKSSAVVIFINLFAVVWIYKMLLSRFATLNSYHPPISASLWHFHSNN